jgi:hypothetical protein
MGQLWGWLTKFDALSDQLLHAYEHLTSISVILDNPHQLAKCCLCLSGGYLIFAIWKRIQELDPASGFERSAFRRKLDRWTMQLSGVTLAGSLVTLAFIAPLPLSVGEASSASTESKQPAKKDSKAALPSAPMQSSCSGEYCGVGGPTIDPRLEPNKINRNDLADHYDSLKTLPETVSTICAVTSKVTSRALFEYEIYMPPGGRCQRFFEASAVSTEMRLLTPQSKNGTVEVRGRSIAYSARSGFRGRDSFIVSRCLLTENMQESCIVLKYAVVVE